MSYIFNLVNTLLVEWAGICPIVDVGFYPDDTLLY